MNILVLAPMEEEYQNFSKIIHQSKNLKHHYKVVKCGIGKANAAATVALEAYGSSYDLCVVVGYAAGGLAFQPGDIVVPSECRYWDTRIGEGLADELTRSYPLTGLQDCIVLTGDRFVNKENADKLSKVYTDEVIFDMEITAVAQICDDISLQVLAIKIISDIPQKSHDEKSFISFIKENNDFSPFLSYLELL